MPSPGEVNVPHQVINEQTAQQLQREISPALYREQSRELTAKERLLYERLRTSAMAEARERARQTVAFERPKSWSGLTYFLGGMIVGWAADKSIANHAAGATARVVTDRLTYNNRARELGHAVRSIGRDTEA